MQALIEVTTLYALTGLTAGLLYSIHCRTPGRLTKQTILFSLFYPATWVGFSILTATLGVYYRLLPNSSISLGIAACLSLFPSALLTHGAL